MSDHDPVIFQMAKDIGEINGTVKAIKEAQESSLETISSAVKRNGERIQSLEDSRKKVYYTAGGVAAGAGVAFPKVMAFISGLFLP